MYMRRKGRLYSKNNHQIVENLKNFIHLKTEFMHILESMSIKV